MTALQILARRSLRLSSACLFALPLLLFVSCEDGAEGAGKNLDEAVEDSKDAVEDAADDTGDAIEDAADDAGDALDDNG